MKKTAQKKINETCMKKYQEAMAELRIENPTGERLRTCNAKVYETSTYWVLKSYNTIIAVTSKDTGVCYDVLRIVYGYTTTSAQHIAKFTHDFHTSEYMYSAPKWVAR